MSECFLAALLHLCAEGIVARVLADKIFKAMCYIQASLTREEGITEELMSGLVGDSTLELEVIETIKVALLCAILALLIAVESGVVAQGAGLIAPVRALITG